MDGSVTGRSSTTSTIGIWVARVEFEDDIHFDRNSDGRAWETTTTPTRILMNRNGKTVSTTAESRDLRRR